jgi:hypothetical protein
MTNYVVSTPVNGTFEVPFDLINTTQTSLNLIGQGVTNYGQAVAQNEINLLQSFAGPTPPNQPLIGQLWYDSTMLQLNVYTSVGTWSPLAYEADLANYATVAQLASTNTALATLASSVVLQPQLSGYVTIAGLYTPPANATAVPIASGGTGITTLGSAGQVLTVNSFGTGLIYASPSNTLQYSLMTINQTTVLDYTSVGSVCNITSAGISVTLPQAARCPLGKVLIFTLFVPSGVASITAYSTDNILSGQDVIQSTYTLYAGEEIQLVSNGINNWSVFSASKVTGVTPAPGDNSINLATTAFVTTALTDGTISPAFNIVSANQFRAAEGVSTAGTQFTTGFSFTGDGDNDTGMFSPSDGDLHLYSNGTNMVDINVGTGIAFYASTVVNGNLSVTGTATGITPAAGDDSTKFATTAFVTSAIETALPFTPVQQGGGIGQETNKVYIGWTGSALAVTVDSTNLGTVVFVSELDSTVTTINSEITSINSEVGTINSEIGTINSEISSLSSQISTKQAAGDYVTCGNGHAVVVDWTSPALGVYVDGTYEGQMYTSSWYQPMTLSGVGSYTIWSNSMSRGELVAIPGQSGTWMTMSTNATGADGLDWLLVRIS